MLSIKEKVLEWANKLSKLNGTEKFEYLIDKASMAEPLEEKYKINEFKIPGCVSQLWMVPEKKDEKLYVRVDADASISKGSAVIIADIFNGQKCSDIVEVSKEDIAGLGVISNLGLINLLTPMRQNGLSNLIGTIQWCAKGKN